jgi:hypothetical protein
MNDRFRALEGMKVLRKWHKILALCLAFGMIFYLLFSYLTQDAQQVSVNFAVKVLDSRGHPVAGADVIQDGRLIGVTDAFGEWRQYQEAKAGDKISLSFVKERGQGVESSSMDYHVSKLFSDQVMQGIARTVKLKANHNPIGVAAIDRETDPG